MNLKKILITGANGFIGKNLLKEVIPKYKIIGVSLSQGKKNKNYFPIKKNILKLTNNDVKDNLYGVIHLAALTDVKFCEKNPYQCFVTNVLGTQKALDIARKKDCKFIFVSTSHVYGKPHTLPIKETHPKNPTSIYAASKLAGEICCEGYSKSYGMDVSIVRLFSTYGPYSPSHLVISRIISQLRNNSIKLGNLQAKRDFVYINDVTKALKLVFEISKGFADYNLGTGKSYSILEVYKILQNLSGLNPKIESVKSRLRKFDVPEMKAETSKIKKLGWKTKDKSSRRFKNSL